MSKRVEALSIEFAKLTIIVVILHKIQLTMFKRIIDFVIRHPSLTLVAVALVMFIPVALMTPFHTKGEPREAMVALGMLQEGNWILPVNFGTDIPYKPPFMAWLIAIFSLPIGHVTELTARLPSIIASIIIGVTIVSFVRRDMMRSGGYAFCAGLLTLTTFEMWRSAWICRVDMLLAAAVVGAVVTFYRFALRGGWWRIITAALLMSAGVLTKGPVGIILPVLIIAIWALFSGLTTRRVFILAGMVVASAICATFLPALWYAEAINQGGQDFINLVLEENVGRFTGTMSYDSHVNPWWYNFRAIAGGLLPYTIILLIFPLGAIRDFRPKRQRIGYAAKLGIVTAAVVFIFYSIPESKRSVYLLPMYPFVAIALLEVWRWLYQNHPNMEWVFSAIIRVIGSVLVLILAVTPLQPWGEIFNPWVCFFWAVVLGAIVLKSRNVVPVPRSIILMSAIYAAAGMAIIPALASHGVPEFPIVKALGYDLEERMLSDREIADVINEVVPEGRVVWETIRQDPNMRYYTIGFYTNDRIREIPEEIPTTGGWLLASPSDARAWAEQHPKAALTTIATKKRSCDTRRPVTLYSITF